MGRIYENLKSKEAEMAEIITSLGEYGDSSRIKVEEIHATLDDENFSDEGLRLFAIILDQKAV
ncbi:hypothetical protein GF354_00420 [Candidatus Peregrinibacteria bacterium]|nr:hypothetical protein [Candidatus Peregrinibacteria bacterium]